MGGLIMNLCRHFLYFAIFSFLGWLYECVYYTVQQKKLVNSGFLSTCFCPIYGIGAMLDIILLGKIENTALLFFTGIFLTCTLEYFVSWLMEKLFKKRWWDYTDWPGNINGRICVFGGIAFGLFTVMLIKFIYPTTADFVNKMSVTSIRVATILIAFVMVIDTIKTIKDMDTDSLPYLERQAEIAEEIFVGRCGELVKKFKDNLRK